MRDTIKIQTDGSRATSPRMPTGRAASRATWPRRATLPPAVRPSKLRGMARSRRRTLPAVLLALLLVLAASPAPAQTLADHGDDWASHGLGEAAFLGLNALVGGLTAGLWQELSGDSFEDGFAGGALGGGVVYAGKRLAAESFPGAGFVGRDVAAVGTSIVRNAADARPLLDSLMLPVGPLRLHLSPRAPTAPRVEVNLHQLYWTTYGLAEDRLELDLGESLSSGAPVFRADRSLLVDDHGPVLGVAVGGVVMLSPQDDERWERSLAHERAHVSQRDFLHHAWFRPVEERLAGRLPGGGFANRIDYDLMAPALLWGAGALGLGDPLDGPIEAEAEFLERR